MLPGEFAMHMTPLSYKLGSLKVQSSHFLLCFGRLKTWSRGNALLFQTLTYDWGPITTSPARCWGKRYPLTGSGPREAFYLGLMQDLTWPLNLRSTAVKRLLYQSLLRRTDSSHTLGHRGWTHTHFHHICSFETRQSPTSLSDSRLLIQITDKFEYFEHNSDTEGFQNQNLQITVCAHFFLNSSESIAARPHEYPASVYKHVHAVGGEDGDEIMWTRSKRV